ncbi:hypothetical protein ACJX0J_017772, partial [Zea mays]
CLYFQAFNIVSFLSIEIFIKASSRLSWLSMLHIIDNSPELKFSHLYCIILMFLCRLPSRP